MGRLRSSASGHLWSDGHLRLKMHLYELSGMTYMKLHVGGRFDIPGWRRSTLSHCGMLSA